MMPPCCGPQSKGFGPLAPDLERFRYENSGFATNHRGQAYIDNMVIGRFTDRRSPRELQLDGLFPLSI
jgi:hypothetical protein